MFSTRSLLLLRPLIGLALLFVLGLAGAAHARTPDGVVVSLPPIHSLVAAVMRGAGTPHLLVRGGASPHGYALRPSDARALQRARVVFMVAPQLERFLEAPLRSLAARAEKVVLIETAGLTLHRYRESGLWPPAGGSHGGHGTEPEAQTALAERGGHQGHGHAGGEHDPHIWLDPDNARILTGRIAAALSAAFPEHAALYARNAAQTAQRLDALRQEMTAQLSPLAGIPFLVFHDAFQYLEKRFSLSSVGALALDPARQPGAARIAQIRRAIARLGVACIFSEPQFRPGLIRQIVRDTGVRSGVLDPLGVGLESGPDLYFLMMRGNAEALRACLQGAN